MIDAAMIAGNLQIYFAIDTLDTLTIVKFALTFLLLILAVAAYVLNKTAARAVAPPTMPTPAPPTPTTTTGDPAGSDSESEEEVPAPRGGASSPAAGTASDSTATAVTRSRISPLVALTDLDECANFHPVNLLFSRNATTRFVTCKLCWRHANYGWDQELYTHLQASWTEVEGRRRRRT